MSMSEIDVDVDEFDRLVHWGELTVDGRIGHQVSGRDEDPVVSTASDGCGQVIPADSELLDQIHQVASGELRGGRLTVRTAFIRQLGVEQHEELRSDANDPTGHEAVPRKRSSRASTRAAWACNRARYCSGRSSRSRTIDALKCAVRSAGVIFCSCSYVVTLSTRPRYRPLTLDRCSGRYHFITREIALSWIRDPRLRSRHDVNEQHLGLS